MKCELQWVTKESNWQATPDSNEAVCYATSVQSYYNHVTQEQEEKIRYFPCCAEHEKVLNTLSGDAGEIAGKPYHTYWRKDSIETPEFLPEIAEV